MFRGRRGTAGRGTEAFNVVVHFPKNRETRRELLKRAAAVHAQTIAEKVKALPCPAEQKAGLLDAVAGYIRKEDGG